jgi:hypothetical protein
VIGAQQISRMRGRVRSRLGSRGVILRPTVVETETGSRTDYLAVSGSIPVGVRDPTVGAETVLAARVQAGSVVTLLVPFTDDQGAELEVRATDRVAVTTTDPLTRLDYMTTMEVVGVAGRLSDNPIVQRAVCEVLQ